MSATLIVRGRRAYLPKKRIRRKVEQVRNRLRYARRVGGRAEFNSLGRLCWIWR